MLGFTDTEGQFWKVNLTLGFAEDFETNPNLSIKEVYEGPASFLSPEKEFVIALFSDYKLQWAIIWLLIHKQAESLGITAEQLKYRINGKVKEEINQVYEACLIDFFPRMETLFSKIKETRDKSEQMMVNKLIKLTEKEKKKFLAHIEKELAKLD